jgi:hypothetical protein
MKRFLFISFTLLFTYNLNTQKNVLAGNFPNNIKKDEITRSYVTPVKIVWQSNNNNDHIKNPEVLLTKFDGQLSEIILLLPKDPFPTPYGVVTVKHTKQPDGNVKREIDTPKEVKVIR